MVYPQWDVALQTIPLFGVWQGKNLDYGDMDGVKINELR